MIMLSRYVQKNTQKSYDQQGLVSLMIVSTIMIVLSLTTIGFSRIMDRELRQALDHDLSAQAYYAAESGLNDARVFLAATPNYTTANPNDCIQKSWTVGSPPAPFVKSISQSFTGKANDNLVQYTCTIINPSPKYLVFNPLIVGQPVVTKITQPLTSLSFSWQNNIDNGAKPMGSIGQLRSETEVNAQQMTGVLKVTIYPIPANLDTNPGAFPNVNQTLADASRTYYLYPDGSASPETDYANEKAASAYTNPGIESGSFISGHCSTTTIAEGNYYCNSVVSGLPNMPAYYIQLVAEYQNLTVGIGGATPASAGANAPISGTQASIDVTGEGKDVLKRISTRADVDSQIAGPADLIQSMNSLCKRDRIQYRSSGPFAYLDDPDNACPDNTN